MVGEEGGISSSSNSIPRSGATPTGVECISGGLVRCSLLILYLFARLLDN